MYKPKRHFFSLLYLSLNITDLNHGPIYNVICKIAPCLNKDNSLDDMIPNFLSFRNYIRKIFMPPTLSWPLTY